MKTWQWLALAGGAVALWLLLRRKPAAAAVPDTATPHPQTPTIGSVSDQVRALATINTHLPQIDAQPSTVAVGWLGQPKIVDLPPSAYTPASAPDANLPPAAPPPAAAPPVPMLPLVRIGPGSPFLA